MTYLLVHGNRAIEDAVHAEDGALRRVDDRGAEEATEDAYDDAEEERERQVEDAGNSKERDQ